MIKKIILILFTFISILSFSQVLKYKSVSWGWAPSNSKYFPKFSEDNSLIFVNVDDKKVSIFNDEETIFYIYKIEEPYINDAKDKFTFFRAARNNGEKVDLIIVDLYKYDEEHGCSKQFVIKDDLTYELYNVNVLE